MPAAVYTELLVAEPHLPFGTSSYGPPDLGYRWVLVDICLINPGADVSMLEGVDIVDDSGAHIFSLYSPFAQRGWPYHWTGRQVVGDTLPFRVITRETGWSLRITGYVLTLP